MAEDPLEMAIATWGPRLTANGVDPSDLAQASAALSSWDDWCSTWSRLAARHEELGRAALAAGRHRSAGSHLAQAATTYHFARFLVLDQPEAADAAHRRAVACLDDALAHLDPPGERHEVAFGGGRLVGLLRLPAGLGPHPTVLLVPGLDSTKEELRLVEAAFLCRGLATFAVDGPGQGEAAATLPIRADWELPGSALLDHLAATPGVDPARLGVWGVSLGGYYAARVAAGDRRVRACLSLCGPYDLAAAWDGLPGLTRRAFEKRSGARGEAEARTLAAELSLSGSAQAIACPLLVVAGTADRLFAWQDAARLVEEAGGPSELLLVEGGNHGCANRTYEHRPYGADWMAARLAEANDAR